VRDHFGNPGPHIQYAVGPYERRALDDAREVVGRIFTAMRLTDVRRSNLMFAAHQIGTHRMGADPGTSVVDPQLRSHDVANLYLVGSGCFVTASSSPPTLTIAALAIRASEHIAARLRPAGRVAPSGSLPGERSQAGQHASGLVERSQRLEDR
jgi:choline dehydrogenase-like flavoprotein